MALNMDLKIASLCARVVALCTNKWFLSAVNLHVSFQHKRFVARKVALVAIVNIFCIMMNPIDFKLGSHLELLNMCYSDNVLE